LEDEEAFVEVFADAFLAVIPIAATLSGGKSRRGEVVERG
jgi:hypothetical protein